MTDRPIETVHGEATHAGLRRKANEDSHLAAAPVYLVADGMGGHEAGARASSAVVAEFSPFAGAPSLDIEDVRGAIARARTKVAALATGERAAGTTLTGVIVADVAGAGYWLTINVGDSRTYRFAGDALEQISVDHSVVQELLDAGELNAGDAARDRRRNEITRAIGAGSAGEADFWMLPAEPGDRILVCSDGLSGELDPDRIEAILREEHDPQDAATRLVHEALLRGGRDNITAIVVDALSVRGHDDVFDTAPSAGKGTPADSEIDSDTRPRAATRGTA